MNRRYFLRAVAPAAAVVVVAPALLTQDEPLVQRWDLDMASGEDWGVISITDQAGVTHVNEYIMTGTEVIRRQQEYFAKVMDEIAFKTLSEERYIA